ncbi:phage tail tape measure protein [Empedobacter falsenii]
MAGNTATYNINFNTNSSSVFPAIRDGLNSVKRVNDSVTKAIGESWKGLMAFDQISQGINQLKTELDGLIAPGASLNTSMLELSAITGVTGNGLKQIEDAARKTSKTFGTDATKNVEAYKMMLSQLSPEIAKNSEAMKMMGDNVNILSKQMGGDTVAATDVLNTSLNQFGVSMDDPIAAAKVMADMMNVMSAAAQQGSAELPQIKQALEQVGMVAKTTGLSFVETNAQIQLLDQSGKKGSEGGIALRNVLTTLSEGRFTSKLAAEGLKQAGISVDYLADTSILLTDRLRTLRKIQGDTALMTKVFGKENMAAAISMINNADAADEMAKKMVNTNSAVEQAEVIMTGYEERMARTKARIDDWKISIFNATEAYLPYIQNTMNAINSIGMMAVSANAASTAYRALGITQMFAGLRARMFSISLNTINIQMGIGAVLARIQASGIRSVAIAFGQATIGATAFQIALDALGIGLILAAIAGLVWGLKYLYENSRKFREILGYIGGAGKAVFHNIGIYVGRLWNLIIKPIGGFIWNYYKFIFTNIWEVVKMVFTAISDVISWAWNSVIQPVAGFIFNIYRSVFLGIWNTVKTVFNWIVGLISNVWNWIKTTFAGFAKFIDDFLLTPIRNAFSGIWNWITTLLNNVFNKLSGLLAPIRELWNKLFSKEGTINVHEAGKAGAKSAGQEFDKEQEQKKLNKELGLEVAKSWKDNQKDDHKSVFDVAKGSGLTTPPIGGVAGKEAKAKKSKGDGSGESQKVRTLNITKLVETINIYNQNGNTLSKESITQYVKEALLTAVADFTLAE